MRILCKIQIAHGDVRTAGAQHRFPVRESDRADLVFVKHQRLCRLVGLVGQCHKEFVRISEEHLVVSADSDSTVFQPALEMFDRVASEGFVEIGLFKFGRAAGHVKHRFPSVPFKVGALVLSDLRTVRRHMDMIAQKCGITQHPLEKIKGILKKFADFFARQSDGIDELIVGMCHPSVHQRGIVICLDNTEGRSILALVKCIEPTFEALLNGHTFRHELQILEAALGNDQLDLLDLPRRGLAGELADLRDAVIRKPLLQICVEGAGLEEAVSEQHHALVGIIIFLKDADIKKRFTVPDDVLNHCFLFFCYKVVTVGLLHANRFCRKAADSVTGDEDRFLGELDDVLDTAEYQRNIRLPGGLVGCGIRREVAGAPCHHIRIQRLGNK